MPAPWTAFDDLPYADSGIFHLMRRQVNEGPGGYYATVRRTAELVSAAIAQPLPALSPIPEEQPLRRPTGQVPTTPPTGIKSEPGSKGARKVAISYVGADQPWAEWISHLLQSEPANHEVSLIRWRVGAGEPLSQAIARAGHGRKRVIAVLSDQYLTAPTRTLDTKEGENIETALADVPGATAGIVKVRIAGSAHLPETLERTSIRLDPEDQQTIERLLEAVR
ncbi:toll/interleukin-1 receptor domain-containing protein [Actinomadura craniellae]|nr:toll/interleukin-1 receptor domain-containing protein [Actinomadura craniellae]